ncbi:hypothetical protein CEXT_33401 [Caerostris extrusa]|uniref:Uncharacterized protein n=1 Tax=Caerostris extrusa TaxID=172846 RepID=A0AAV4T624_CAEEX|nr:hypothetical protein CEXT_33401 [Caerostris extrusa]
MPVSAPAAIQITQSRQIFPIERRALRLPFTEAHVIGARNTSDWRHYSNDNREKSFRTLTCWPKREEDSSAAKRSSVLQTIY